MFLIVSCILGFFGFYIIPKWLIKVPGHIPILFGAKEAFAKALGTGFRNNLNFKDIEIINDKLGKPCYVKTKKITEIVKKKFKVKKFNCFLSISDEKKYSTAFAIIQSIWN